MTKAERLEKMRTRFCEMTARENQLRQEGIRYIAGMDEVGRGPLAGPVYTACVVLPADFDVLGVDDSKKLSEKKRIELDCEIRSRALAVGIGIASPEEIDEINILEATKKAMVRAYEEANRQLAAREEGAAIQHLMIDALELPAIPVLQEGIIHGDATSISIAAASIVAKVARDAYMVEMDAVYPGYAFASNKGYGTAAHYAGIRENGITPIHRRSFLRNLESRHGVSAKAAPDAHSSADNATEDATGEEHMASKKFYAVRNGREPGIYTTWEDCKKQVEGFSGAEYKSFQAESAAKAYLGIQEEEDLTLDAPENKARIYVDGSYNVHTKKYACGIVILYKGERKTYKEAFENKEYASMRNIAGEVMGAVRAIQYCQKYGIPEVEIYHDYNGIGKWGNGEWKANMPLTQHYKAFVSEARKAMKITFTKVDAHTGDRYNEMADQLAKDAIGLS